MPLPAACRFPEWHALLENFESIANTKMRLNKFCLLCFFFNGKCSRIAYVLIPFGNNERIQFASLSHLFTTRTKWHTNGIHGLVSCRKWMIFNKTFDYNIFSQVVLLQTDSNVNCGGVHTVFWFLASSPKAVCDITCTPMPLTRTETFKHDWMYVTWLFQ